MSLETISSIDDQFTSLQHLNLVDANVLPIPDEFQVESKTVDANDFNETNGKNNLSGLNSGILV